MKYRIGIALSLLLFAGCGGRGEIWDKTASLPAIHGLSGSVALLDVSAERAMMIPVNGDLTIDPVSIPIRRGFAASSPARGGSSLLVLCRGDVPREDPSDQGPSLTVIDGGVSPKLVASYTLSDPLSGLSVDPEGRFAAVYSSPYDDAFVSNPNELVILDLDRPPAADNPSPLTLRSFGGRPESLTFTPELAMTTGKRRLLVVLTDRDAGLIDLAAPDQKDITVKLSTSGERVRPLQVAVTDGDPDRDDDARLAIRLESDSSVILIDFVASPDGTGAHDFKPLPNVALASGVPTDIAFVSTDGGQRLAALVPSKKSMTLIDPATSIATEVALGERFEKMSLVTNVVGSTALGADVALLWSGSSPYIAFVALGSTAGKPYKAVERLELEQPIANVIDVPAPNDRLKILAASDGRTFFVLDLVSRTAAPIVASYGVGVTPSPDGERAWLYAQGASHLASLGLGDLHPRNITLKNPIARAFDVGRRDGGRALVAVHGVGAIGVTALDAVNPSLETATYTHGVLLGGLQ